MGEQDLSYDAFISYSRQDKVFATLLKKALENFQPPRGLGLPQRYLKIFLDEEDFTGPGYDSSLRKHLQDSARLLVVCSPAACRSQYVDDEIRQFVNANGAGQLVPVLISGIPNNEARPDQEAEFAFPKALCEALRMPLAADYRGFNLQKDRINKGRFKSAWSKTLADLYSRSREQIEQREKKRQIYRRNLNLALGGFVIALVFWPAWLWQKGYNLEHGMRKIQSLVVSIYLEPEKMVPIPAGTFQMGEIVQLEEPWRKPHSVTVKPFAMGMYEVAFDEYDRFAITEGRSLPSDGGWGRGRRPVINVSWEDAKAYVEWLAVQTGKRYRLPTEAEWEYAARSGAKQDIWAGTSEESQLTEYAVFGTAQTAQVGTKRPNGFGLHDMTGNVWEWVEDCVHKTYGDAPQDGSAWLKTHGGDCNLHVLRGGSWYNGETKYLRASNRLWKEEFNRFNVRGFRLAQDIP